MEDLPGGPAGGPCVFSVRVQVLRQELRFREVRERDVRVRPRLGWGSVPALPGTVQVSPMGHQDMCPLRAGP